MTFEQLEKIKNAVEAFPKTRFVSMFEEGKICIQNTDTEQMFEIEYEESECGMVFKTKGKKALTEKKRKGKKGQKKIEEFKENCNLLANGIKGIFAEENFDDSIDTLKNIIRTLPVVDASAINEEVGVITKESAPEKYVASLVKNFGKKMQAYYKEENEFKKAINFFDDDNELIEGEILERAEIAEMLKQTDEAYEKFLADSAVFKKVQKDAIQILGSEKLVEKFFEGIDFSKNIKVGVTKTLVSLKQTDDTIDLKDASTKLVSLLENNMLPVGGAPMPAIYNLAKDNKYTPRFLRFKMGVFSLDDVRTMINEVNEVWSRLGDYDEEDMMFMSDTKMKLEYMYNSQQLNDHLIAEIVESFNQRFAKDSQSDFDDATKQLAWKDRAQQKVGHKQGIEVSAGPVEE